MQITNVSPFGDLELPALGIEVPAGATIEVPDDLAASLLEQPANWAAASITPATTQE